MAKVVINKKHAQNLQNAMRGAENDSIGFQFRTSIKTATETGTFSIDALIERIIADKK